MGFDTFSHDFEESFWPEISISLSQAWYDVFLKLTPTPLENQHYLQKPAK
jgi:hypothetical protein